MAALVTFTNSFLNLYTVGGDLKVEIQKCVFGKTRDVLDVNAVTRRKEVEVFI